MQWQMSLLFVTLMFPVGDVSIRCFILLFFQVAIDLSVQIFCNTIPIFYEGVWKTITYFILLVLNSVLILLFDTNICCSLLSTVNKGLKFLVSTATK